MATINYVHMINSSENQICEVSDSAGRKSGKSTLICMALLGLYLLCSSPGIFAFTGYTDVTATAGINYKQNATSPKGPEGWPMAGGAAAGDYDNDGNVDLFVTRMDAPDILYRNQGDGTFIDVSATAFADAVPEPVNDQSNGAAWGDIDNDGDLDLYVLKWMSPRYYLYINNGDGTFTEDAQARNAAVELGVLVNGTSATFGDYDSDGNIDLFTGEWRATTEAPIGARLLHNLGNGFFEDKTMEAGVDVLATAGNVRVFSPRFSDLDNDGRVDLAMSADFGNSRLFWNEGGGIFSDGTVSPLGSDMNGMGATIGDFDGDGYQDWFVTAIETNGGNWLYRNNGDRSFTDVTDSGPVSVRSGGWGWGTSFLDYDNDGDQDLTMTNGWPFSESIFGDFTTDPIRMWRNEGGQYVEEVATAIGLSDTQQGRGLLTFDYDNDGDLDMFVVNNVDDTPILYRNDGGNSSNWVQFKVKGVDSNRDGIGARVRIIPDLNLYDDTNPVPGTFQDHELHAGSNYLSQNEMLFHFGLGNANSGVDRMQITWPSGQFDVYDNVAVNKRYLATEYGAVLEELVGSPELISPVPGTGLPGETVTFSWTAGSETVSLWALWVGTTPGGYDLLRRGHIDGGTLSTTVGRLPTDGSPVYVRLRYKINGVIAENDYVYTAAVAGDTAPGIVSPTPGGVLPGETVTFDWTAGNETVSLWALWVGTTPGGYDLLRRGHIDGATLSTTASGLPTDGRQLYVRLRYKTNNGVQELDYVYTAAGL